MPESIRKIAAGSGIGLGIAHLVYGALAFRALTPEYIWFAGAGVAMIGVGLTGWRGPARAEAAVMGVYLAIMASVLPLPQVFLGLAIFVILFLSSGLKRRV